MLEVIHTPELAAQVTLLPVDAFEVDAAIVFADILPPLVGMGLDLDFVKGDGPRIGNPISSTRDVDLLGTPPAVETLARHARGDPHRPRRARRRATSRSSGSRARRSRSRATRSRAAPRRDFTKTKAFMLSEPAAWKRLLGKLVTVQADYLLAQAAAGAQALQVFDSWAGRALGREDYLRYVAPHNRELFARSPRPRESRSSTSRSASARTWRTPRRAAETSSGSTGRFPLDEAWAAVGFDRPVQGNLDPASLLAPWRELAPPDRRRARARRRQAGTRLQRGARAHSRDSGRQRAPSRRARARAHVVVSSEPIGVLVMAYGGPASLDEIPGYLADIRSGRPTPRAVLEEITENYRAIGGSSPLLEVTRRQVDALAVELGPEYRCYLGMRHWAPWIEDVVGEMVEDGVTRAVSLVLAPHFSAMSVARYQQRVADGLELSRGRIRFEHVPSYHDATGPRRGVREPRRGRAGALARGGT